MRTGILVFEKTIISGADRWQVTGLLANGLFLADEVHGDVNKVQELAAALREFFLSKPRYARHMETSDDPSLRNRNLH